MWTPFINLYHSNYLMNLYIFNLGLMKISNYLPRQDSSDLDELVRPG